MPDPNDHRCRFPVSFEYRQFKTPLAGILNDARSSRGDCANFFTNWRDAPSFGPRTSITAPNRRSRTSSSVVALINVAIFRNPLPGSDCSAAKVARRTVNRT